jgi:hypothetical protein
MPTAWDIQGPWWVLGNFEIADVSLSKFCDTQHLQIFGEGVGPRAEKRDVPCGCARDYTYLPSWLNVKVKSEHFGLRMN